MCLEIWITWNQRIWDLNIFECVQLIQASSGIGWDHYIFLPKWRLPGAKEPRWYTSDMFRFTVTAVTPWCSDLNSEVLRRHRSTWPKHVTSMTWTPEPLRQKDANSKHRQGICIDIFIHIYIYMSNYMAYTLCTHDVKSQNTDVSCNTIKHSLRSEIRAAS